MSNVMAFSNNQLRIRRSRILSGKNLQIRILKELRKCRRDAVSPVYFGPLPHADLMQPFLKRVQRIQCLCRAQLVTSQTQSV